MCLNGGAMNRIDAESETLIAHSSTGAGYWQEGIGTLQAREQESHEHLITHALRADGLDASEDGTGRGTPLVPIAFDTTQITSQANRSNPQPGDPCHTISAEGDPPAIAFSCKDHGADAGEIAPTLRSMGHDGSHANGGGQVAVAFNLRGREGGAMPEPTDVASLRSASGGSSRTYVGVRRLMPVECERLQGMADGYTAVKYNGKPAKDGPRYKAIGNSMAVPVLSWILGRMQ